MGTVERKLLDSCITSKYARATPNIPSLRRHLFGQHKWWVTNGHVHQECHAPPTSVNDSKRRCTLLPLLLLPTRQHLRRPTYATQVRVEPLRCDLHATRRSASRVGRRQVADKVADLLRRAHRRTVEVCRYYLRHAMLRPWEHSGQTALTRTRTCVDARGGAHR